MSRISKDEMSSGLIPARRPLGPYKPVVIIHGGAGAIKRSSLPPSLYARYQASLLAYVTSAKILLDTGSDAVSAACHAVGQLEDDPLFNCGRGSVFTIRGEIEMEASLAVAAIDDDQSEYVGKVKRSAAVSMVTRTRHPILLAKEVLEMGEDEDGLGGTATMHGHLSGKGVEEYGWKRGLERMGPQWFWTRRRWEEHQRGLKRMKDNGRPEQDDESTDPKELDLPSQGTVGAVCMDSWGIVAAATSTGGLTNKLPGRIGDTPTVGAGFWAESWVESFKQAHNPSIPRALSTASPSLSRFPERIARATLAELRSWVAHCLPVLAERDETSDIERESTADATQYTEKSPLLGRSSIHSRRRAIAMSGTGNGDSFLRTAACRTVAAMARFSSLSLADAVEAVAGSDGELQRSAGDRWGKTGEGQGGIIGIELVTTDDGGKKEGQAVFAFNCGGMWRAYFEKDADGREKARVMVFREEY